MAKVTILTQDVITGFSFSFASALLKKLKALKAEDRILQQGCYCTDIAFSVITHLCEQMKIDRFMIDTQEGILEEYTSANKLISLAEEFLAIFKKSS